MLSGVRISPFFLAILFVLTASCSVKHVQLTPQLPQMKAATSQSKIVLFPLQDKRPRRWPARAVAIFEQRLPFMAQRPVLDLVESLIRQTLEAGGYAVLFGNEEGAGDLPLLSVRVEEFFVDITQDFKLNSFNGYAELRLELSVAGKVLAAKTVEAHQKRDHLLLLASVCQATANGVLEAALVDVAKFVESDTFVGVFSKKKAPYR